jgi:hypothetical protein
VLFSAFASSLDPQSRLTAVLDRFKVHRFSTSFFFLLYGSSFVSNAGFHEKKKSDEADDDDK